MKKILIALIIIVAIIISIIFITTNHQTSTKIDKSAKILVVYFSAQNHTKEVALKIANDLNADLFEITPSKKYSESDLDWTNQNSRVSKEHNNKKLQEVKLKTTKVPNWNQYDTIILGYPIWYSEAAWPVTSFVKANNFTNKKIIPFCTSASSSIGNSAKSLGQIAGSGNWQEGTRFQSNAQVQEIEEWLAKIK